MMGWGLLFVVLWLMHPGGVRRFVITVGVGLVVSHGLRWLTVALGWMRLPFGKAWVRMLMGVLVASFVAGLLSRLIGLYLDGFIC
jgi:hypothetical protein